MAFLSGRRLVDLSLPITNFSMEPDDFVAKIRHQSARDTARQLAKLFGLNVSDIPTGEVVTEEFVSLAVHSGTHVDAPAHYGPAASGAPGREIEQVPLEWCCGDGVVVDLTSKAGTEPINDSDIERELGRIGHELSPGEIVLLHTGWDKRFADANFASEHPGPDRSACEYLLDRGVRMIGIDANSLDLPTVVGVEGLRAGDPSRFLPCHYLGREREYLQIEKLANLEQLPPAGFVIFAFPVLIEGCGASWTRAVALVDESRPG